MPNFANIGATLDSWLETWVPRRSKKHFYNFRTEPGFAANQMDVDRLRNILATAETGNVRDLFALYRDVLTSYSHMSSEFDKRKMAVLGDAISIQPPNKKNRDDVIAAQAIAAMVENTPNFIKVCAHWLDSALYPLSVVEKVFCPSTKPGLRFELARLNMVPHIDLDYSTGFLQLWELDPDSGYISGTLEVPDPTRYIIHRGHLLQQADYWGGPMRCLLFWWLMSAMDRDWWVRFLDRYGAPFIVGKFDPSDDASRSILMQAFNAATKIFGLVVSKETQVELIQAASQTTGEAFAKFKEICDEEVSKKIVGQIGSSKAPSGNLNSGKNQQHETIRQDIRQFDQTMLGDTLRDQLFRQYLNINGFTGSPPKIIWGGMSPEEQTYTGTILVALSQAGLELTDEGVNDLGEKLAMPLQRAAIPAPARMGPGGLPFSVRPFLPLTADQRLVDAGNASVDRIAANSAADLSQAFRGSLAPIRRIILESKSANECSARVAAYYADWNPERLAPLIEEALIAFTANGAASRAR